MAKGTTGPIRLQKQLAMDQKPNIGGRGKGNYASGGPIDPRYQTLEQKRDTSRAKDFVRGAAGEDESGETILSRAAKAIKRAVGADYGMKTGGTVKRGKAHSDAAQDRKIARQEIAKAQAKGGMKCGGAMKRGGSRGK